MSTEKFRTSLLSLWQPPAPPEQQKGLYRSYETGLIAHAWLQPHLEYTEAMKQALLHMYGLLDMYGFNHTWTSGRRVFLKHILENTSLVSKDYICQALPMHIYKTV